MSKIPDRMTKWFDFHHLPSGLQSVSSPFHDVAVSMCEQLEPGPERTFCLRMLLLAKDAAVRAAVHPGG